MSVSKSIATPAEARILALESLLGIHDIHRGSVAERSENEKKDVIERLDSLNSSMRQLRGHKQVDSTLQDCERKLHELEPGSSLTHALGGATSAMPLIYRRQEILASVDRMKKDLAYLSRITELLHIGSTPAQGGSTTNFQQAPIIASERYQIDDATQERLSSLSVNVAELHSRTKSVSARVDALVDCYSSVISAANEKMVFADQHLSLLEGDS